MYAYFTHLAIKLFYWTIKQLSIYVSLCSKIMTSCTRAEQKSKPSKSTYDPFGILSLSLTGPFRYGANFYCILVLNSQKTEVVIRLSRRSWWTQFWSNMTATVKTITLNSQIRQLYLGSFSYNYDWPHFISCILPRKLTSTAFLPTLTFVLFDVIKRGPCYVVIICKLYEWYY